MIGDTYAGGSTPVFSSAKSNLLIVIYSFSFGEQRCSDERVASAGTVVLVWLDGMSTSSDTICPVVLKWAGTGVMFATAGKGQGGPLPALPGAVNATDTQ
jgi:hypothetical protein